MCVCIVCVCGVHARVAFFACCASIVHPLLGAGSCVRLLHECVRACVRRLRVCARLLLLCVCLCATVLAAPDPHLQDGVRAPAAAAAAAVAVAAACVYLHAAVLAAADGHLLYGVRAPAAACVCLCVLQGLLQQMDAYYTGLRAWLKARKEAKEARLRAQNAERAEALQEGRATEEEGRVVPDRPITAYLEKPPPSTLLVCAVRACMVCVCACMDVCTLAHIFECVCVLAHVHVLRVCARVVCAPSVCACAQRHTAASRHHRCP